MADMRRRSPEPPPGPPLIEFKPGTANEMLRELAPLLAEEGIDVDNIDAPDLDTLQAAMNRAVERHNLARFTPVGHPRDLAVTALRLVIEAVADGDTALAGSILERCSPSRRTTPSPPSPAASVWPWACSMTGSPVTIREHRPTSVGECVFPAGTGSVNAPQPTSSPSPARDAPSAHSTP